MSHMVKIDTLQLSNTRSGGILVAIRNCLVKYVQIIKTDCKYVLWFKINKFIFNTIEDVLFGVCYIPHEGSRYSSNDCFLEVEQELIKLVQDKKYVCLMGDFNARIGHMPDYFTPDHFLSEINVCENFSHSEIEIRSNIFEKHSIPLQRVVQDSTVNNYGYKFIDMCKSNDI